jgi:transposase
MDIAKHIFQVHGEDAAGEVVLQKRLRRGQVLEFFAGLAPALVGIEACGSSHYWARELVALGHEVRLMPAAYVKPFVQRNKTDARDAAAICVALGRPAMRYVAVKSAAQQAWRGVERSRDLLVKQHTQLMNAARAQLAEHGLVAAQGLRGFQQLAALVREGDEGVPAPLALALSHVLQQIDSLGVAIQALEKQIVAIAKTDPAMRRLTGIPGIGPLTAHAIVAAVGDGRHFSSARDFAAWCGLTPREHSTAGKHRKKGISRQGDKGLRKLFALGASAHMRVVRAKPARLTPWQRGILARRPVKVAVLAQAAKNARTAWAVLTSGEPYRKPAITTA